MRIAAPAVLVCAVLVAAACGDGSGHHRAPPVDPDGGPPTVHVPSATLDAWVGTPVTLDASGSSDPDGRSLAFSWTIRSHPAAGAGTLAGAATATPEFTADGAGTYVLDLVVQASDGQTATTSVTVSAEEPTRVRLVSDPGDYIGRGVTREYTGADAIITLDANGGKLSIGIAGSEYWDGDFEEPNSLTQLQPGTYAGLHRWLYPNAYGGLGWSGEGRECNTLTGSFTIDDVTYEGGAVARIDLTFEQHCEGGTAALRGEIHWRSKDTRSPVGPTAPPPGLWAPAAGATPASGNYVYLESQPGDPVGLGGSYTYTLADAILMVSGHGTGWLYVTVDGDESWTGTFQARLGPERLQPGYYGRLQRYSVDHPARGGLDWGGEGRGCDTLTGWFVVDAIAFEGDALTAIDLRFEQHCRGVSDALRGKIHWTSKDTTTPPGPVLPPPVGLWAPAAGATPASGNYLYLISDPGDRLGRGETWTFTSADSILGVSEVGASGMNALAHVWADNGVQRADGMFAGMSTLARLEPGYYGSLMGYPFHNPVRGGLAWSVDGESCSSHTSWFVVDAVTYSRFDLTSIDLRFEARCEDAGPALHGQLHWNANEE